MLFSSPAFLFVFLPYVLLLYYAVDFRFKNYLLFFASLIFYIWGESELVLILLLSITVNYLGGLCIFKYIDNWKSKLFLSFAVFLNLAALIFFKYANFIVDNINHVTGHQVFTLQKVHLPLGISFFTFQGICYVVDVYRKKVEAQKNPYNLALATAMFPHQIAGPIIRYNDIADQIIFRKYDWTIFSGGIQRFIIGLAKKMLIANTLGAVADKIFTLGPDTLPMNVAWLGTVCYALQIYYDFSGYSDMAIGLGRMFGFTFLENFNFPYAATSIKDFWRRWHISLSSWFRDYVYISLGGDRISRIRTYINLIIVFFLTGLWHGAGWNFIVWGIFHGFFLVLERLGFENLLKKVWRPVQHGYTLFVVLIGWVFFKANDLPSALHYLKSMFGFVQGDVANYFLQFVNPQIVVAAFVGIAFSFPIHLLVNQLVLRFGSKASSFPKIASQAIAQSTGVFIYLMLFLLSLMTVASSTYNPFIYFRF